MDKSQEEKDWHTVWFKVKGPLLVWFEDEKEKVFKGIIHLQGAEVSVISSSLPAPVTAAIAVKAKDIEVHLASSELSDASKANALANEWVTALKPLCDAAPAGPKQLGGGGATCSISGPAGGGGGGGSFATLQRKVELTRLSNQSLSSSSGLESVAALCNPAADHMISKLGHLTIGTQQKVLSQSGPSLFCRAIPGTELAELGWQRPANAAIAFRIGEIVALLSPAQLQGQVKYPGNRPPPSSSSGLGVRNNSQEGGKSPTLQIDPKEYYILGVIVSKVFENGAFTSDFRVQVSLSGTLVLVPGTHLYKRPRELELLKWRKVTGPGAILGKGAFGVVYSAMSSDGRPLAVKELTEPVERLPDSGNGEGKGDEDEVSCSDKEDDNDDDNCENVRFLSVCCCIVFIFLILLSLHVPIPLPLSLHLN